MVLAKSKSGLATTVALCLAFVTSVAMAATIGWHGLSQSQRNSRIIDRAEQDRGRNVRVECKEWVQRVVNSASDGVVTVPQNRSDTEWRSNPDCHRYPQPFQIEWIRPGQIIQMRWTNQSGNRTSFPHTAIVLRKTSTGMTWIDSNWQGDRTVRTHTVSFDQFRTSVRNNFSVYEIR